MTLHNNFIIKLLYSYGAKYPTPSNLSFSWNFGILGLIMLFVQIISGIILAMKYIPNIEFAFISVEHIVREVNCGWLLRSVHANGASFFFIVIYAHICRGILYGSYIYPRRKIWYSGVIIFLLMIITAFLGYILPWGQMSLWAATVITNLASTIPIFGEEVVQWLWSGFSVANATLNKFYSLHFLLPFFLVSVVVIHVILLHNEGSSNPLGIDSNTDKIYFTPYYTLKDLYTVFLFLISFSIVFCFFPDYLGHTDNYLPANSDATPEHIVPEWYFLGFYAILRAIPDKVFGVLALFFSLIMLFLLPRIHYSNISQWLYKPFYHLLVILFLINWLLLSVLGMKPIEEPFLFVSKLCTVIYFSFFVFLFLINIYYRKRKIYFSL